MNITCKDLEKMGGLAGFEYALRYIDHIFNGFYTPIKVPYWFEHLNFVRNAKYVVCKDCKMHFIVTCETVREEMASYILHFSKCVKGES